VSQTLATGALSVTIEGLLGAAPCRDGSWIVRVPPTGARIVAHSGSGAMLNVRGTNTADVHTNHPTLPIAVVPGDALVVAKEGIGRNGYWDVPGRSSCSAMLAVTFVPWDPVPGLLRCPAIGNDLMTRFLRSLPLQEDRVAVDRLPSVVDVDALGIDWTSWGAGKPTIPYLTALLRPFSGEYYDGWATDTRTPDHQHPGYGTDNASVVSQALVQLCSTASAEEKRPLALAVVQRGLDLVGAFLDGRRNTANGGHAAGRKALIVAAGHLLGIEAMADPVSVVGQVFSEDDRYTANPWWFGWQAGWRFVSGTTPLADPPSTWGPVDAVNHDSFAWQINGYLGQTVGAQVGTALAMRLLGRTRQMGASFDGMVAQFMQGPPPWAEAQLHASGIAIPWGRDYSVSRGAGFCAAAWRQYSET
jgi:hypothetical protein